MKEIESTNQQIDELLIKLRNLQILLEEAVLHAAHGKARDLIAEISDTTRQIEEIRHMNDEKVRAQAG